jgi:hypothetical protein
MDYLSSLKKRLADNEASIASLKDRLAALEMEQHKLTIALEVVSTLDVGTSPQTPSIIAAHEARQLTLPDSSPSQQQVGHNAPKPSGKDLILKALAEAGFPLTRMDVVSRLAAAGHYLNSTTVGSTLSRLVDAGLVEKASHSQYQIKRASAAPAEEEL